MRPTHGIRQVRLPWAEAGARFTSLFERLAIDVLKETDVRGATRILRISWDEAWRLQGSLLLDANERWFASFNAERFTVLALVLAPAALLLVPKPAQVAMRTRQVGKRIPSGS